MTCSRPRRSASTILIFLAILAFSNKPAAADGGVTYHDIADDGVGLAYARTRSPEFNDVQAFALGSLATPMTAADLPFLPQMTGGYPGVVVWDYDGDGDLDIYASNGPGSANSLFQSQLVETGSLTFVDVAVSAGVAAIDQDSAGVCYGDLDNDGDPDLAVMGRHDANRLFENRGDGTFSEVAASGIEAGDLWSTSCAVGDVDGDGLLDLFIANSAVTSDSQWIFVEPFAFNQHNQLLHNDGGLTFTDVSASAGIEHTLGLSAGFEGNPTVTWSATLVDVDLDGDLDITFVDDQAAIVPEAFGGVDSGLIHVFENDGTGFFTDRPIVLDDRRAAPWMGVAYGDLNCDGRLDLFASNFGDYALGSLGIPSVLGFQASRWFLGNGDATFVDPGTGGIVATPFGWGTAIFDYDNDGDLDILSHGGLDVSHAVIADNPGTILQNRGCSADFTIDFDAIPDDPACVDASGESIPRCTQHIRRNVRGVAVGDLDGNGFTDVVTTANITLPADMSLVPAPNSYGAELDGTAFFVPIIADLMAGNGVWVGSHPEPGNLAVELASANGNGWAGVRVQGSIGLTPDGRVNRDGIGAVLAFTPRRGTTVTTPVTGGSSHLSQNSPERIFGLGSKSFGRLEVLWPGGHRNRLYGVRRGERLTMPEIPCSFDDGGPFSDYLTCVATTLVDLHAAGVIDRRHQRRLFLSAAIAFFDAESP